MDKHTTDKIKIQPIPKITIPQNALVQLLRLGESHQEVLYMENKPKATVRKISKTQYQVIATGEIKDYVNTPDEKQSQIIKKSMKKLEHLIKTNFDTVRNELNALFVTLTYEEKCFDCAQLYDDFDKFMKRLRYRYSEHNLEYIVVAEPHADGSWHLHMLLKSDQTKLFIDNNETMYPLWGHGFTKTVRLESDDVGCYYTAYFSNVEAPIGEESGQTQEEFEKYGSNEPKEADKFVFAAGEDGKKKRFKKGDRLRFYPKHMKFYRCSRGIIRPKPSAVKYSEVPKDLGNAVKTSTYAISKTYKKYDMDTVSIRQDEYDINKIQRQIYKKKTRKKNN